MSLIAYPLDDIEYSADDASLYNSPRTSGVYSGEDFTPTVTGADMTITIGPGLAWMRIARFRGLCVALKEETAVDFGIPDAVYPRIDHLALQFSTSKNAVEFVAVKGTPASNPLPPDRSTTESQYELHLLEVLRRPGTVSISAADVTDLRLDSRWCGLMACSVTAVDTAAINAQFQALLGLVKSELLQLEAGTAVELKKLQFADTVVPASAFVENDAPEDAAIVEAGYGYRAAVPLSGVLSSMVPEVIFSIPDAASGIFAASERTYDGGVYLYASDVPEDDITIPTIYCLRGNA